MGFFDNTDVSKAKENRRRLEQRANNLLKKTKTRRGKRKKHKPNPPLMNYRQYIRSSLWRKRKNDYYGKYGKKCAVCRSTERVALHHKVYDQKKFGYEPDEHLVALCQVHHQDFHDDNQLSSNMVNSTDTFVEEKRQLANSNIDDLSWI